MVRAGGVTSRSLALEDRTAGCGYRQLRRGLPDPKKTSCSTEIGGGWGERQILPS